MGLTVSFVHTTGHSVLGGGKVALADSVRLTSHLQSHG